MLYIMDILKYNGKIIYVYFIYIYIYVEPYVKLLQWKPLQVLAVQLAQVESMASSKRKALGSRTSDRSSWASSRRRSHIESSGIFFGDHDATGV